MFYFIKGRIFFPFYDPQNIFFCDQMFNQIISFTFSDCNFKHMGGSVPILEKIANKLPQLFQNHTLCASGNIGRQGACQGDSGGPLMDLQVQTNSWVQFAIVQGGVGECGNPDYPGIFIRVDYPSIIQFILSITGELSSGNYFLN